LRPGSEQRRVGERSSAELGATPRAEITDAAMSQRAQCVMLNKGGHVLETVRILDGILKRMEAHQRKKSPTLRALKVSLGSRDGVMLA
jgi:pyruvate kinase